MFGRRKIQLDTLSFDTTNWILREESPACRIWFTPENVCINTQFFDSKFTYPYDLTDLASAQTFYNHQSNELGGAMISVEIGEAHNLEYLRGVFKYRSPQPGSLAMYILGIIVLPFEKCFYQVNIEALEVGTTGMREAAVMALGDGPPEPDKPPQVLNSLDELFTQSRNTQLRRIPADEPKYDELFPEHPLSQVHQLQTHIINTMKCPGWLTNTPKYRK